MINPAMRGASAGAGPSAAPAGSSTAVRVVEALFFFLRVVGRPAALRMCGSAGGPSPRTEAVVGLFVICAAAATYMAFIRAGEDDAAAVVAGSG